mmetsp:Transcript_22436/g.31188  ORF Transcript_22436/g.31188 Transcript_22436/m.31188 type:complete len:396 (-) Transcript_22436:132-1319(-)|eukprot:CAMPEP_0196587880 /NCGR_PEP_ID=MMETSP1081-20130531/58918_1 /TAXON_ID=36882 /ORGANISM="Pyramimonas amylifera, Strain CCMP720" /LENGTH=395 /DNA_ID=CAMNT_0041910207 /DNA_START=285 /DNA_END=1472 /DNA_ORIENTATION=+
MTGPNWEELATKKSARNDQVRSKLEDIKQKVHQRKMIQLSSYQSRLIAKLSDSYAPWIGGALTAVLLLLYVISSVFYGGSTGIGMFSPLPDMNTTSSWEKGSANGEATNIESINEQDHIKGEELEASLEGEVATIVPSNFTKSFFSDLLALPFKNSSVPGTKVGEAGEKKGKEGVGEISAVEQLAELPRMLEQLYPKGRGMEVGVGQGELSALVLKEWKSASKYILLDPFSKEEGFKYGDVDVKAQEVRYNKVRKSIMAYSKANVARTSAAGGYKAYGRRFFHFIYLDNTNDYDVMTKALENYYPKVIRGGILAGSFFLNVAEVHAIDKKIKWDESKPKCEETNAECSGRKGIRAAVEEFARSKGISDLFFTKDKFPTWYFQKPSTYLSERVAKP